MSLWNEVRFALRQLRGTPTFTLVVLGTLGLCLGDNTAVYSVLDAVLLRSLPYPEPDRLALLTTLVRHNGAEELNTSQTGAQFEGVRDGARHIDVAAFSDPSGINFATRDHVEYVQQQTVVNKKRLEESNPEVRQTNFDELRRTAADPRLHKQFLMRTSLIESVRKAREIP